MQHDHQPADANPSRVEAISRDTPEGECAPIDPQSANEVLIDVTGGDLSPPAERESPPAEREPPDTAEERHESEGQPDVHRDSRVERSPS